MLTVSILLSVAYAIQSTDLYIIGRATGTIQEQDMPVVIIPEDETTGDYIVTDFPSNIATIESQYTEGNVLVVNYTVKNKQGTPRSTNISINFQNNNGETIINGASTYEITGNTAVFQSQPQITTTPTLEIGETGTVSINITRMKFNSVTTGVTCKIKLSYDTASGNKVEFYIQLNFNT